MLKPTQGGISRLIVSAKVTNALAGGCNRAEGGVAAAAVAHNFSPNTVLLRGEGVQNEGNQGQQVQGNSGGITPGVSDDELDVGETKGSRIGVSRGCIFTGPHQEIKAEGDHIGDCQRFGSNIGSGNAVSV